MVGDDDQSIYAFRGATIKNILNFEKDYSNTATICCENKNIFGAKSNESFSVEKH